MTNGTIQNNTANSEVVLLRNNAKLNMSGGTIINNQAINGKVLGMMQEQVEELLYIMENI